MFRVANEENEEKTRSEKQIRVETRKKNLHEANQVRKADLEYILQKKLCIVFVVVLGRASIRKERILLWEAGHLSANDSRATYVKHHRK